MNKSKTEPESMAPAPVDPQPYTLGQWREFTQWRCVFCPWDTLDGEAAIMAHYQANHAPPPEPPAPVLVQSYDRFGNPVPPFVGELRVTNGD